MTYTKLLLSEITTELENTRKTLDRVPEGRNDFRPHEKSYRLSELAGHVAEMPMFMHLALTSPDFDLGASGFVPLVMESKHQLMAAYDERAERLLAWFTNTSDETFEEHWKVLWGENFVFSGARYDAYRSLGMNHLLHHRAQLGVYLRLLEVPVPCLSVRPFGGRAVAMRLQRKRR